MSRRGITLELLRCHRWDDFLVPGGLVAVVVGVVVCACISWL